jgi:hypothetical protein
MRAILCGVSLLAAASAWAGSAKVAESADTAYYVDDSSISGKGDVRRVSVIQDYAKQEPGGVRSRRIAYEIDCAGERLRSVAAAEYSQSMAQGNSVNSWERESDWLYVERRTGSNIPSRTPYRPILRYVCSR